MATCWLWHRWGKWGEAQDDTFNVIAYGKIITARERWVQQRTCQRCDATEWRQCDAEG